MPTEEEIKEAQKFIEEISKDSDVPVEDVIRYGQVASLAGFIQREELQGETILELYTKFCKYLERQVTKHGFACVIKNGIEDCIFELDIKGHISLTDAGERVASLHNSLGDQ